MVTHEPMIFLIVFFYMDSYFMAYETIPILVGGFNPFEKYSSKWVHLPQISG